jgi:hypothetical protein
MEDENKRKEI